MSRDSKESAVAQEPGVIIPTATYRWQFHGGFRFSDATALAPYLAGLGISHCYASPYLKAHPGSPHGYDIADHQAVNPEIGTDEERREFVRALKAHGLKQIVDVVPNHMRVDDPGNRWWWDVLQTGKRSPFAHYFDIDWESPERQYVDKVVIPILGDQYGEVLESGELRLAFDERRGDFVVRYYEHALPLDPVSYAPILAQFVQDLGAGGADGISVAAEVAAIQAQCESLEEARTGCDGEGGLSAIRRRLLDLFPTGSRAAQVLGSTLRGFNGGQGQGPQRFDALHELLERQAYRLAFWRVSSCEINYRRFFDINELAALRVEAPEVFAATHALIGEWVAAGDVAGLRIDHPDGLRDPFAYFSDVNAWARCLMRPLAGAGRGLAQGDQAPPLYLVAEKILGADEMLPTDWPVHGTTGYDFTALVNGLLVDPRGEQGLEAAYADFVGGPDDYREMLYACKKLVMHTSLASEVHSLGIRLDRIAELDRRTRDFTLSAQTTAIFEIVACFPVYRTYVTEGHVSASDRLYIEAACRDAKTYDVLVEVAVIDFIQGLLLLEGADRWSAEERHKILQFVAAFQQYTSPVMAKGLEDTLFYRYNRLISLNEVGANPSRFSVSLESFHQANTSRQRNWPHTMVATSSHDTKRSEDARARLDVLSEIPALWREQVRALKDRHSFLKSDLDGPAPSARDEYLFYQTLVCVWPLDSAGDVWPDFRQRVQDYMLKAVREAKVDTSWIRPSSAYEDALGAFVGGVMDRADNAAVLDDLAAFIKPVARVGLMNSLSQTTLKLTVPGVPDFYQGTELWDFSLVDPDNRRPVDYAKRVRLLRDLSRFDDDEGEAQAQGVAALLASPEDGRIKMHLTRRLLWLRGSEPELFAQGGYRPLTVRGSQGDHLVCFVREWGNRAVYVIVPRHCWALSKGATRQAVGTDVWGDTVIECPPLAGKGLLRNVLTGELVAKRDAGWMVADVLRCFPIAVLAEASSRPERECDEWGRRPG